MDDRNLVHVSDAKSNWFEEREGRPAGGETRAGEGNNLEREEQVVAVSNTSNRIQKYRIQMRMSGKRDSG
jgi:hypothetical protein